MKYSVVTFGCRVNQADSLGFEEDFRARGASPAAPEEADVVVVNTCSVTSSADQAARQTIRRLARVNPDVKIVVTGCYATRRPDEIAALPNVLRVISNDDKPELLSLLAGPSTAERFGGGEGSCGAAIEPGMAGRTAFTLRVQTGCAESCSYCIIPATRGLPRSVPVADILAEVERVSEAGFKEIALTGVHLGSYGRDLSPASSLIELLRALSDHVYDSARRGPTPGSLQDLGLERRLSASGEGCQTSSSPLFRISSLEPMDCTPDVVGLVATSDRFAPHFHLPLQHASNRMLTAMRRPYTIEYYAALVNEIRARMPHASIGSDIIVGFPGESDEDFAQLVTYLESSPLTHVHVFPYSDRPGTAASKLGSRAAGTVVRERARRVREIGHTLAGRFRAAQRGTVRRGLTIEDGSLAVTDNYLKIRIPPGHARNEWLPVHID